MSIPWLDPKTPTLFPDIETALDEPNGLLAVGGDLSPARLIAAYSQGIFPWYDEYLEDGSPSPILWWSPNPRYILRLSDLKISRSLQKSIRNKGYIVRCNHDFLSTITACAETRTPPSKKDNEQYEESEGSDESETGTWINTAMINAYQSLHEQNHAHSIECWHGQTLIGGLYGVSIGRIFYGESMFSRKSDASKIALVYLCHILQKQEVEFIDCQVGNPHLASLGASELSIDQFKTHICHETQQAELQFPTDIIPAHQLSTYSP